MLFCILEFPFEMKKVKFDAVLSLLLFLRSYLAFKILIKK